MDALHALLTEPERAELVRHTTARRFARHEVVFHEGDPADSLHLVERGLFVARSSSTLGHVLIVNVFPVGSVFGELSLILPDTTRSATVAALQPGATRMLRRAELDALRDRPLGRTIDRYLLRALAERNRALTQQVVELLFTPSWRRIQRQILTLDRLGIADRGDGWIALSQDELAMLTASTRATVNRVLRDLERQGVIELARGRSRVTDRDRLAQIAG
jgi:CRP/FNR family cyclic AMP-dependent transcriptional regulator